MRGVNQIYKGEILIQKRFNVLFEILNKPSEGDQEAFELLLAVANNRVWDCRNLTLTIMDTTQTAILLSLKGKLGFKGKSNRIELFGREIQPGDIYAAEILNVEIANLNEVGTALESNDVAIPLVITSRSGRMILR